MTKIERKVEHAAKVLGGQYVTSLRGVPRIIFGVIYGGVSVCWFHHTKRWRVFEPDPDQSDGQRRTDFRTVEEVAAHLVADWRTA